MTDPIEDLIRDIPLKSISESCDQKILAAIRTAKPDQLDAWNENLAPSGSTSNEIMAKTKTSTSNIRSIAISIAASLLIGFFMGSQFKTPQFTDRPKTSSNQLSSVANSKSVTPNSDSADELANANPSGINRIELIENESETFILSESLQWKNQTPFRRVETITHKKVLVTDDDSEPKQIEVPIRKVTYTLADSI